MPASVADSEHDRADREVDAADQHDERHAEAEHQHRGRLPQDVRGVARACRRPARSATKSDGRAGSAATSIACRDRSPRQRPAAASAQAVSRGAGHDAVIRALDQQVQPLLVDVRGRRLGAIAPSRTTRMRSASASTSARSDDTRTIALPASRQRIEPAVDLGARADIDAARRLDQHEDVGVGEMPAREQRLLLVAAGQRPDRRFERARRPRRSVARPRFGRVALAGRPDDARRAGARASEATAMFSRSGRLGRMPSCLRSSVSRQMPAATASCGDANASAVAARLDDAAHRRAGRRRSAARSRSGRRREGRSAPGSRRAGRRKRRRGRACPSRGP